MTFRLTIKTDNAAFEDREAELARILRDLADRLDAGRGMPGSLHDYNGNAVGTAGFGR